MPELTIELQRMADDAASQARPPAVAEIFRQGDRRRRHSLKRRCLGGLSAASLAGAAVALGLGLTGSGPTHGMATIRTAAFTLVSNADGTATLTINPKVLLEPGILQRDLERDGIPAIVTAGSFCYSDPPPAGFSRVVRIPGKRGSEPQRSSVPPVMTISPAAMPPGTELSFGNFKLSTSMRTYFALIDMHSYTCTSAAPTVPAFHGAVIFDNQTGTP